MPDRRRPSLTTRIIQQQLLVAIITAVAVLVGLLWLTDQVLLTAQRRVLHKQVKAVDKLVDTVDDAVLVLCNIDEGESAQSVALGPRGYWRLNSDGAVEGNPKGSVRGWKRWTQASEIIKSGSWYETGQLPWTKEDVIWAASVLPAPDGSNEIVVAWEPVRKVRNSLLPVYALVAGSTLTLFGASLLIGFRTARRVTRALDAVAESSTRMAGGDYEVRLPAQSTRELDQVSTSINRLAQNLRTATAALQDEHTRLVRLEGLQRQFVADASHELRAPLTSMRVTLEAWQDGVLEPTEHTDAVAHLLQETKRLGRLVTTLLDLSRIESGRVALQAAPLSIRETVADAVSAFREVPGAAIDMKVPAGLPAMLADADAVPRILLNLLANARRYTPETGHIQVWARAEEDAVQVGVTDTGSGISPDFLPRIWDRFARAEGRTSDSESCGLGLAIVKALVEAMGGSVGADSTPGEGATVWFRLPAARNGRGQERPWERESVTAAGESCE